MVYFIVAWRLGIYFGLYGVITAFGIQLLIVVCMKIYKMKKYLELEKGGLR